ncbi:ABC transporter ATP-binding protein [Pyramidobacter sp. SM-530-WT-4B]|uniref:ABC transporter ATP-binding protein n=1 Tax=Pyramidobacter porci TaxID=2605789 RepID=A0A6L5YEM3_9BACT|nr:MULTISPECIES: ABC transporter ATP-binding protein [Pyramidobacter]MDY2648148.1 ABC transporter ATP-binding protein [Pyramidobacter porci]MDY4033297.1 ABC transporter ATP-binding protein [Pyramidobacter sp.]MST56052.1 ABC transporter ATP-binding protein [Pyramidobacter porci]
MSEILLEVKDLHIHYATDEGVVKALNGASIAIREGKTLGLVGETGAGKSTLARGVLRLVPDPPGKIVGGEILFEGRDLLKISEEDMKKVRGRDISMIFQDPMTSLNPVLTVGDQILEVIETHHHEMSRGEAKEKAEEMLEMVGIAKGRYGDYPHQFSGGMKQRVVIAIALACKPRLLIADEPTTALDVTIQAQILDMINQLKRKNNTSMLLITHDLGVVAQNCDDVAIVYAGEIVEVGSIKDVYREKLHPYTSGLFGSVPSLSSTERRLRAIDGMMPDPTKLPGGCKFYERCPRAAERCRSELPALVEYGPGHKVRCFEYYGKGGTGLGGDE